MENKIRKSGVLLLALFMSATTWAQKPQKVNRQKMKAYVQENILPVAIENRNDLESILSSAEREKIEELRERQETLREQHKSKREQFRNKKDGAKNSFRAEPTDEQLAEMRLARKERRLIETEAFEIIDEHEDFFIAMESDLKDDRAKWRSELKEMMEDGRERPERADRADRADRGERGRRGRGPHDRMRRKGGLEKIFTPVAFLLLDPDNPELSEGPEDVNVYPNPAANQQIIAIDLNKSSIVKVELIDADGKSLRTLFNGNLDKGTNNIEVDLSELDGQQYFYKITTPTGSKTKRVLLKN